MSIISVPCETTGKQRKVLIAPRGICDSCGKGSGPKFELDELPGPSLYHRRNIMPLGARREVVASDLLHASRQIMQLNKEIDRLEIELSSLKIRRELLRGYKAQETSLFAPVRLLPDDILRRIFLMVRDACDDYDLEGHVSVANSTGTGSIQTPTQVCGHWRSLTLSFPGLWSRVTIACDNNVKDSAECESYLEKFVTLSKDLPLILGLSIKPEMFDGHLVRTLANSVKRWKEVKIHNYAAVFQAILRHIPPDVVFSRLESLYVLSHTGDITVRATPMLTQLTLDNGQEVQPAFKMKLESAPSLSDLSVTGMRDLRRMLVNFPWAQITTFSCTNCVFAKDELISTLSSMPSLKALAYHGETYTSRQLVLRGLQVVTLGTVASGLAPKNTTAYAIDLLVTPKLKELRCVDSRSKYMKDAVFRFLQRSSCYLEALSVFKTMIGAGWRSKWLANLKRVRLIKSRNIGGELRWLTRNRKGGPDVLPHLETLELQDIPFGAKTAVRNILPMIKSRLPPMPAKGSKVKRRKNITYLKSVSITFERDLRENERRQLCEFVSSKHVRLSGIVISVAYGNLPSDTLDCPYEEYPSDTDMDTDDPLDDYSISSGFERDYFEQRRADGYVDSDSDWDD